MQKGAKADAAKNNVKLTVASGKQEGDDAGPDHGDRGRHRPRRQGHPDHPDEHRRQRRDQEGPRRRPLRHRPRHPARPGRTRSTSPSRPTTARPASSIGKWAAAQLDGKAGDDRPARPVQRQDRLGRLQPRPGLPRGHGHRRQRPARRTATRPRPASTPAARAATTRSSATRPSNGAEDGGRTAMEKCLAKNPNINVVYTINEPTAVGANDGAEGGRQDRRIIVSVDGGCAGVDSVKSGVIGATAQQYPLKMADARHGGDRQDRPRWREAEDLRGSRLLQHRCRAGHRQAGRRRRQHHLRRRRRRSAGATDHERHRRHLLLPPSSLGGGSPRCSGSSTCCTATRG